MVHPIEFRQTTPQSKVFSEKRSEATEATDHGWQKQSLNTFLVVSDVLIILERMQTRHRH